MLGGHSGGGAGWNSVQFTEHGPAIFFEVERWALREKIARARFVVAITHFCRSQLMLFSEPKDWGKITIVHCGVDVSAYGRKAVGPFGKRVAFVGRLDPVKGALLLIEAMAEVLKTHPDASLTLAGDGPARAPAEAQAAALGISGAVKFAGFMTQGEVAELLAQSDMLVLPSFAEGLPVVYMEALASRIPVVASRVARRLGGRACGSTRAAATYFPPGPSMQLCKRGCNRPPGHYSRAQIALAAQTAGALCHVLDG